MGDSKSLSTGTGRQVVNDYRGLTNQQLNERAHQVLDRLTISPIEALVIDYHKTVEGEYGCPGLSCPGVQRLLVLARQIVDAVG